MNDYTLKDSGERRSFSTGSVRDKRDGKGRFDLIPPYPLFRLARVYEEGAKKYTERNWERGQNLMATLDSALRHCQCLMAGEQHEDHATQAVWNLFAYIHTLNEIEAGRLPKELDDRPDRMKPAPTPVVAGGSSIAIQAGMGGLGIRSAADLPKIARLKSGFVAYVGVWELGGCAWCGGMGRDGKLYVHNVCEDIPHRDVFSELVAACAAGSKVL